MAKFASSQERDLVESGAAPARGCRAEAAWYGVWVAMAVVACVGELVAANGPVSWTIFAGRCGLLLGALLVAVAWAQLSRGVEFLSRKERALAVVVLVLFGFAAVGHWLLSGPLAGSGVDFASYYRAGQLVAEKQAANLYRLPLYPDGRIDLRTFPFIYPPIFAVLMRPFTLAGAGVAYLVWNVVDMMLILVSCGLALNLTGVKWSWRLGLVLVVGALSFYPVIHELHLGQVGGWILFFWTGSLWLLARGRVLSSAFCFALATMIKLTPAVAVPLLVMHRRWKWLIGYTGWLIALFAFSVWQVGWAAQMEFVGRVMPSISCGAPVFQNASIVSWVQELMLGRVFRVEALPDTISPVVCLVSRWAGLVSYCVLLVWFYRQRDERNLTGQLVLAMLVSLVVSPISWWQHYVISLAPLIYMWGRLRESSRDPLLVIATLVVGTNVVGFALMLVRNHLVQILLAGVVPCLMVALVWRGVSAERGSRECVA